MPSEQQVEAARRAIAKAMQLQDFGRDLPNGEFVITGAQLDAFEAACDASARAALEAAEMAAWQPIESAPPSYIQDDVLVFGGRYPGVTMVMNDGDWWRYHKQGGATAIPTHWQPLPAAPQPASKEG